MSTNHPQTREEQLALTAIMRRKLLDEGIILDPSNLVLLLASGIWEEAAGSYREADRIAAKLNELLDQSTGMIKTELALLMGEYVAKRKLTDGIVSEMEDLRTRLNNSNVEDVLRGLEDTIADAKHITPKLGKLLSLIEEITGDIEDL